MRIDEIKAVLRTANPTASVFFDFCGVVPTTINSWRGIYAEPALGWSTGNAPNVKDFLAELDKATSGHIYRGWKGGKYSYTDYNELHVDNPGDCTFTMLASVELAPNGIVVLHTQYCPD